MKSNETAFTVTGTVSQKYPLQGSFCNVRVECDNGDSSVHTVCLDQDLTFPAIGERIRHPVECAEIAQWILGSVPTRVAEPAHER